MSKTLLYSLFTFVLLFLSNCSHSLDKGQILPFSDASAVWENLQQKNELHEKRIALKGFISLDQLRIRGNAFHCQLVDHEGHHLLHLILEKGRKNSLKLDIKNTEKANNLHYIDIDMQNSYILDNEGNNIPLQQNILLSFNIRYSKNAETKKFVQLQVAEDGKHAFFEEYAKKGQQYYLFTADSPRIDSLHP